MESNINVITQQNVKTKEELKKYFETGDYPTQNQFAQLIDSYPHLSEFNALINSVKKLERNFSEFKSSPIIKVYQPFEAPTWLDMITYANQAAHQAGLLTGDTFWMEVGDMPNAPLVLMKARDVDFSVIGSGLNGAGIGGSLVEAWANAKSFNSQSNNEFFCGGVINNVKIVSYNDNLYLQATAIGLTIIGATTIRLYDSYNNLLAQQTGDLTANFGKISQNSVAKVVFSVDAYRTQFTPLCTKASVTFTP